MRRLPVLLVLLPLLVGCAASKIAINPEPTQSQNRTTDIRTLNDEQAAKLLSDYRTVVDSVKFMQTGVTLSRFYCDIYFQRLIEEQTRRNFARSQSNLAGGLTSAILGLASAGSGVTGGVGALFSFIDATFENFDANFLVSPDIPAVYDLVRRAQKTWEDTNLGSANANLSFAESERLIKEYANICSFIETKRLVTEAVQRGETFALPPTSARAAFLRTVTLTERDRLAQTLGVATITDDHLIDLYWAYRVGAKPEEAAYLAPSLEPLGIKFVNGQLERDKGTRDLRIQQHLDEIASHVDLGALVAQRRGAVAAALERVKAARAVIDKATADTNAAASTLTVARALLNAPNGAAVPANDVGAAKAWVQANQATLEKLLHGVTEAAQGLTKIGAAPADQKRATDLQKRIGAMLDAAKVLTGAGAALTDEQLSQVKTLLLAAGFSAVAAPAAAAPPPPPLALPNLRLPVDAPVPAGGSTIIKIR